MSWDTSQARAYSTTVRVNGVVRPHDPAGISWAQDITSDLPATVTAGGQVSHRTGTIVWLTEGVPTRTPSPWYAGGVWTPTVGDKVTIDVQDGQGNTYRVFTGVIDTVEGDAHGYRSSKIVAEVRGSNRVIRRTALTHAGGLVAEGRVGRFSTTPVWLITEICRELGYSSVPPAPAASKLILDAPLQGSTYNYALAPYVNAQVVDSYRTGQNTLHPLWTHGRDGFGVSNAFIEWEPSTGGGTGAASVGVSLLVYSANAGATSIRLVHGADSLLIRVGHNGAVTLTATIAGASTTQNLTPTVPAGDGPHRVSLIFRSGWVNANVAGQTQEVQLPTPGGAVTRIRLANDSGACVSGLQVWHPSSFTDHHAPEWVPTAFYRYGSGIQSTILTPSVRDQKAGDVLSEYADALLCPMWVDGSGVLQVVTGKALHDQAPSLTVDALRDVSELGYSMALLDHRPTVEVTYAHAHPTNLAATEHRTLVWQGDGSEVRPGTPDETFVEIPDNEEWIGLSNPAQMTKYNYLSSADFPQGLGSWWGASREVGDFDTLAPADEVSLAVETLTPWAWKLTTSTTNADGVVRKTENGSLVKRRYREVDLPIFRARAVVRYEDRTVAASTPGASSLDGVLSHDAGRWITTTSAATNLATWIHSMVGTPTPVLDGLRVRFDPRIEVGVKITVNAQAVFGVDFQALVLSVDHDPGTDTTTVVARVTRVTTYTDTFDAVDYAHIGQSLAAWDAARTGRTLDEVAANPYL